MFSAKNIKTAAVIILLCVGMSILWWKIYGTKLVDQAHMSEIKANLASLITSEEAYYQEYTKYSSDFKEIGFVQEGQLRSTLYLDAGLVPQEYKDHISATDLPYVAKDDYQILIIYKSESGKASFYKFKFGGTLQEIKIKE
jgi:hypothetical protein